MSFSDTKNLVLNSAFEDLNKLEPFVQKLQEWAGLNEEDSSRVMLTLSEAVNNAIMHGNKENPEKQVQIRTNLNRDEQILEISVEDEGEGFNPDELPDPLKEENLLNEGGRGIYLIKQYADNTQFFDSGRKVVITFHLDD